MDMPPHTRCWDARMDPDYLAPPPSTRTMMATPVSPWSAVATTFMVGCVFTAIKFVLIGRLALDWNPTTPGALEVIPFQWLRDVVLAAYQHGALDEALSQAMSAVLTFGLILGFPINGPLAGTWRCNRLFAVSTVIVGLSSLMALWFDPWLWACVIGLAYGAACAARGKIVPLLSRAIGSSNTLISGAINASLAIGLMSGTLIGSYISEKVGSDLNKHLLLVGLAVVGVANALLIRVPEPASVPFATGMRAFATATSQLFRRHWALLVSGGLAWGITTAASLAMYMHAIDKAGDLRIERGKASLLVGFAAIGAIVGNLLSHWGSSRRFVIGALLALAAVIGLYPHVVHGFWSAAVAVTLVGLLFAAPANVLDARFLANAHDDGLAGLGGTVMSFIHSFAIMVIGVGLFVPLLLGIIEPVTQFIILSGIAVASCAAAAFAKLGEGTQRISRAS